MRHAIRKWSPFEYWNRHHHRQASARAVHDLHFSHVALTLGNAPPFFNGKPIGVLLVNTVTLIWTIPTTRKSGAGLALTDIDHFSLTRNGVEIQKVAVGVGPTQTATDTAPLTGADTYDVFTITKDGFISDVSNDAVVTVAAANPASAVTDLKATLAQS
jgi:hypothetical protein